MSIFSRVVFAVNLRSPAILRTSNLACLKLNYVTAPPFGVAKIVKIDTYESRRKLADLKLKSAKEELHMRIITSLDAMHTINSRDVQELIYTAEPKDLELVVAALKKLELQSEKMRFSSFNMDAIIMRMYSYLDLPEEAGVTYLDPDLKKLFVGYNSTVILLELLYRHGKYQNVIDCVECLEKRQNWNVWSARSVGAFYMVSCLKLNTPEALKKGLLHFEKVLKYRAPVPQLAVICAVIALNSDPSKTAYYLDFIKGFTNLQIIKLNIILQKLVAEGKLSDVVKFLKKKQFPLTKDTVNLITALPEEKDDADNVGKVIEGFKIHDFTIEDWLINEELLTKDSSLSENTTKKLKQRHQNMNN